MYLYCNIVYSNFSLLSHCVTSKAFHCCASAGVLIEAVVWSVDPYMRVVMSDQDAGETPVGGQVAK